MNTNEIVLSILLKGAPANSDYLATIEKVPALAELAAGILLERAPSHRELLGIIFHTPEHRRIAWMKLLKSNPEHDEVIQVAQRVEELRSEAWEWLAKDSPTNSELVYVVKKIYDLQMPAWQLLERQSPNEADLLSIFKECHNPLRSSVINALLKLDCQNDTLLEIIEKEEGSLRDMVIEVFLSKSPSKKDIYRAFRVASAGIRARMAQMLIEKEPSPEDLRIAVQYSEALCEKAAEMLLTYEFKSVSEESWGYQVVFLWCAKFREIALEKWEDVLPRQESRDRPFADDYFRLHENAVEFGVPEAFQVQVARRFLQAAGSNEGDFRRQVSSILQRHPELGRSAVAAKPSGSKREHRSSAAN